MTVIYRKPQRLVVVRGTPLARVLTCRVTDGFDQQISTGDVIIPYPPPATVGHRSAIRIYLGATTPILRFTGFVTAIRNTIWPTRILLSCEDVLSRTVRWKPETIIDLRNLTDEEAIQAILTTVGIPFVAANIQGTGKVIGTDAANQALLWQATETALSKIQQIDALSVYTTAEGLKGIYRTYADRGGTVWRIPLNPLPSATASLTFTQGDGLDIEDGDAGIEAAEPSDTATAAGFGGLTATISSVVPWAVISNPQTESYPMLETITPSADQHDLTSQAEYLQERKSANLLRGDFTTRRDDVIGPFATIHFDSTRAMTKLNALVQSKTVAQNERGGLTQQVSWISYRELNVFTDTNADGTPVDPYPEFDPSDGSEIPPGGIGSLPTFPDLPPESDTDVIASFVVTMIDVESVLVDGAYQTLYTAAVESTSTSSTGTITALAWTAGGGGTPASGDGTWFNPSWTDLASATVTLQATDSNGNTATAPALPITLTMGAPVMRRELYTAEGDAGDFDGTTWRTDANSVGAVGVVANGPLWAADDTAQFGKLTAAVTNAPESEILAGFPIKSVWVERDVSTTEVAAGLTVGYVVRSHDAGDNWTETTRLAEHTEDVLQVILSRYTPGQIWALQASAIWLSGDDGGSWGLVRAAAPGQSFIALRLGPSRNLVSSTGGPSPLERAEAPGTPFTFTGTDPTEITGIAFNTYADEVCAITGDTPPKIWVTDGIGSFNMVPAGVPDLSAFSGAAPYPRNLQQDGSIARMVYVAVGDWALKSTSFFEADSVHVLRHVGEAGCGAGPIAMIGQGDLVGGTTAGATSGVRLYVAGASGALWKSTDGGATWAATASHGFGSQVRFAAVGGAGGNDILYIGDFFSNAMKKSTDGGASWTSVTNPGVTNIGVIEAAADGTVFAEFEVGTPYVSTNGGTSWTALGVGVGAYPTLSVSAAKLWLGSDDGTSIGRANFDGSGGETITLAPAFGGGGAATRAVSDTFALVFDGGVYVEKVSGTTATDVTPPTVVLAGKPWRDATSSDGGTTLVALICDEDNVGAGGELWRSANGGSSWTLVKADNNLTPSQSPACPQVVVDPADPTRWYVCGGDFWTPGPAPLWTSTDNGATWSSAVIDAGETELYGMRAVAG